MLVTMCLSTESATTKLSLSHPATNSLRAVPPSAELRKRFALSNEASNNNKKMKFAEQKTAMSAFLLITVPVPAPVPWYRYRYRHMKNEKWLIGFLFPTIQFVSNVFLMIRGDFMRYPIQFIALWKSSIFGRFRVEFSKNRKCPVIYVILASI